MQTKSSLSLSLHLPCSLCLPFSLLPPSKLPTRVNCHLCLYSCCLPTDFSFVFACLPFLLLPLPPFFLPLPWSPCSCYAFIAIVVAALAVMLIIYIARAQHELRNCVELCALFPPLSSLCRHQTGLHFHFLLLPV